MNIPAIIMLLISLAGCICQEPTVSDGPGMAYKDADYRTEYANVLDFDSVSQLPF